MTIEEKKEAAKKDLLEFEKEIFQTQIKSESEFFHLGLIRAQKVRTYFEAIEGTPSLSYLKYINGRQWQKSICA